MVIQSQTLSCLTGQEPALEDVKHPGEEGRSCTVGVRAVTPEEVTSPEHGGQAGKPQVTEM